MKIALDVPEEHCYIGLVRLIGRALLEHHHAAAQDVDDIETVVGELCANATHHAHSEAGCYQVTLEHRGDHVVLVVADGGLGFDPEDVPPVGTERQTAGGPVRHGGFGLHLVGVLMDAVTFSSTEPTGTTVRTEKRLLQAATAPRE